MPVSSISFFVFFPVSGSLCPSKVCLSFISFSATYFYLLLCPYFLFLGFFLSVNGLLLCFLICLYASSLLVNGTWSTFSHSALLSSSSDFSLYHGVCHTLSFRDLMPLDISSEDYLCFLSGIHAIFLLFSLFLLFPHCFFFSALNASPSTIDTGRCSALQWILALFYLHLQTILLKLMGVSDSSFLLTLLWRPQV